MKLNVSKEYIRRFRQVLKSKLNDGNLVRGVNNRAVFLLRYSTAIISWSKSKLQAIDRIARKLFIICGALHPKSHVDRLYIPGIWYEPEPESGLENEDYKILWDFSTQTDHVIEHQRPYFAVVD